MLVEQIRGNLADGAWRPANTDVLRLDQWEAQKRRLRKLTDGGVDIALSLDRGTRLRDGDVLWADEGGDSIIVARLEFGEVMLVDLPRRDADGALRAAVELGHAIGDQHWPAVVKGGQVLVPVTLDREVMDSVMRSHAFTGISHRFVPGTDVIAYLAPQDADRLWGTR
ncbi:urease accessory protein UreE [Dactylosporangium siamense]|uniref:Urease accessory protein UreE n=1 Tax=Dactylosporangium siamense TaxID=685454 RepID=A0A919PGX6_9ACTN|nr:urease accessory protein UreE [Dactylosporangium siamense]GIG44655.1 urease accessory protein UreE [Dactylosporangium siamense]